MSEAELQEPPKDGVAHALLLAGVLAIGDVLQGLGLSVLMARLIIFFPAVVHWFSRGYRLGVPAKLAHGARAALWLHLGVGTLGLTLSGGYGYPTFLDATGILLFGLGITWIQRMTR